MASIVPTISKIAHRANPTSQVKQGQSLFGVFAHSVIDAPAETIVALHTFTACFLKCDTTKTVFDDN